MKREINEEKRERVFEKILNDIDDVVFLKTYGDLRGKVRIDGVMLTLLIDQILGLIEKEMINKDFVEGLQIAEMGQQEMIEALKKMINKESIDALKWAENKSSKEINLERLRRQMDYSRNQGKK